MNIERINEIMKTKELTIYRLSKMSGINDSQLNKIMKKKIKNPRIDTVKAIAKALEVDINEII